MSDKCLQALERAFVTVQDGLLVSAPEAFIGAQQAGHEEVEDAPELGEPVFDGRAGEGEAMQSVEALDRACRDGRVVLDVLGLVERDGVQIERLVVLDVAPKQII